MRCVLLLVLTLLPALATAGAWPREAGSTFLSVSAIARADRDSLSAETFPQELWGAFYLEYGLTPKITVGIDAGYGDNGDHTILAFARYPLGAGQGAHRLALKAGAGTARMSGVPDTLVMAGFDWGRGFQTRLGDGWLSLETGLHYFLQQQGLAAKADLTLGLKPWDGTKLMLQLQAGQYPGGDPYLRLAPSVARQIRKGMHLELGLEAGIAGDDRVGIKLGTWLEF